MRGVTSSPVTDRSARVDPAIAFSLVQPTWRCDDVPVAEMPIESIVVSNNGHGKVADVEGLVASVREHGVIEPLIVAPDGRLLAGRRRLEAARRAGLTVVPVRVRSVADERAAIEISLVENVERADLDPLTRAESYRALIELGAKVEDIAGLVGQGTGHVYQHLQLLDLHPQVQHALHARTLSFADARALAPLVVEDQAAVLQEIQTSAKALTSRQVKARADARRVMRLVHKEAPRQEPSDDGAQGNYAALFDTADASDTATTSGEQSTPLDQLNAIIAEMIVSAQGEDQVRAWARRLSHILGKLQAMNLDQAACKKKEATAAQERLL